MSPSRRPRVPRRADAEPQEPGSSSEQATTPSEDSRASLSRRVARNSARAEETPDQAAERHLAELDLDAQPPTAPVTVRVNDPEKVHPEPITRPSDAESRIGLEPVPTGQEESTDPEVDAEGVGGPSLAEGPGARPGSSHNVVDLVERRRVAEDARDRGAARRDRGIHRILPGSRVGRLGAGALILLLALLLFCGVVFFSPLLSTDRIVVEGTGVADKDAVAQALEPLQGTPLPRVTEQRVKDLIGENITIRDVSIEARPPHELVVTLHERVPVVTVKEGDQYVLVDKDGTAVGSVPAVEQAQVPLVQGGLQAVQQDSFRDVVDVLQALPQSLLQQMTSAQAKSATEITLEMKDGSTVQWGTSERSEYKAQVLSALVKSAGKDGGVGTYDVSSPDHPVTTA